MKLQERKVNVLTRQLENFKKEKLNEELELEDKAHIEVPIVMGSQLKDIKRNKEKAQEQEAERQKVVDEFKKDEEKNIKEAKDKWKDFVGHLEEDFKDLYLKENNNYTVNCKGRKELRTLIEQCKENNIKYKWEKLVEGDYKYNVKFSLKEDWEDENTSEPIVEPAIQEPQPEAINLDNLNLGQTIVVTQNLLDALMQTKASVEQMANTITNASEPITQENGQEVFPVEQEVEIEDDNDDLEIEDEETFEENLKKEVLDETKLNEEKYSDEEFEIIENALYDAGLEPSRFNDMGVLTKNLGWVVKSNGKTIYLTCDGTWLDESLKEGYDDVTVGELKEILNNVLDKLNQMNDDENLPLQPNTYKIGNPYISIASKGFIDLSSLEDKSQTYYYIELDGRFLDSYKTKEEAIEIASQMYEDGEGKLEVYKDINDGYDTELVWSNGELLESAQNKQPKQKINEALQVLGSLEDYSPSPSAKPLYDLIVKEGMLEELDKVLREIYQDGASIEELNNLLSTEKDFVKSMLGLDEIITDDEMSDDLDKEIEDETIEEIEKEDTLPTSEKEPEPKDEYLNDETGYGLDDEEEDLSDLDKFIDSEESKDF